MGVLRKFLKELGFGFILWALLWNILAIPAAKSLLDILIIELFLVLAPYIGIVLVRLVVRRIFNEKIANLVNWVIYSGVVFYFSFFHTDKTADSLNPLPLTTSNVFFVFIVFILVPWFIRKWIKKNDKVSRAQRKAIRIEKLEKRAKRQRELLRSLFHRRKKE